MAEQSDLPPGPYHYETTARPGEPDGNGHVYIIDAAGKRIGVCWGKPKRKMALAALIIEAKGNG